MAETLDDLAYGTALCETFERIFGRRDTWPPQAVAAHAQLRLLRRLIGDEDYDCFLECAVEALDDWVRDTGLRDIPTVYLGLALGRHYGESRPASLGVTWGTAYGLCVMLQESDYEAVIRAAAQAWKGGPLAAAWA